MEGRVEVPVPVGMSPTLRIVDGAISANQVMEDAAQGAVPEHPRWVGTGRVGPHGAGGMTSPPVGRYEGGGGERGDRVRLRVLNYQLLASTKAIGSNFPFSSRAALNWLNRRKLLLDEIVKLAPDIACLQDVDQYRRWWQPWLFRHGLEGTFCRRDPEGLRGAVEVSRGRRAFGPIGEAEAETRPGVAIVWRRDWFRLGRGAKIALDSLVLPALAGSNDRARAPTGDVALVTTLFPTPACPLQGPVHVVCAQLTERRGKEGRLVREWQTIALTRAVEAWVQDSPAPVLVGISLHAEPQSRPYHILRLGTMPDGPRRPSAPLAPAAVPLSAVSARVTWPLLSPGAGGDAAVRRFALEIQVAQLPIGASLPGLGTRARVIETERDGRVTTHVGWRAVATVAAVADRVGFRLVPVVQPPPKEGAPLASLLQSTAAALLVGDEDGNAVRTLPSDAHGSSHEHRSAASIADDIWGDGLQSDGRVGFHDLESMGGRSVSSSSSTTGRGGGGFDVEEFPVERVLGKGSTLEAAAARVRTATLVIPGLAPGATYRFRLRAISALGRSPPSPPSEPVRIPATVEEAAAMATRDQDDAALLDGVLPREAAERAAAAAIDVGRSPHSDFSPREARRHKFVGEEEDLSSGDDVDVDDDVDGEDESGELSSIVVSSHDSAAVIAPKVSLSATTLGRPLAIPRSWVDPAPSGPRMRAVETSLEKLRSQPQPGALVRHVLLEDGRGGLTPRHEDGTSAPHVPPTGDLQQVGDEKVEHDDAFHHDGGDDKHMEGDDLRPDTAATSMTSTPVHGTHVLSPFHAPSPTSPTSPSPSHHSPPEKRPDTSPLQVRIKIGDTKGEGEGEEGRGRPQTAVDGREERELPWLSVAEARPRTVGDDDAVVVLGAGLMRGATVHRLQLASAYERYQDIVREWWARQGGHVATSTKPSRRSAKSFSASSSVVSSAVAKSVMETANHRLSSMVGVGGRRRKAGPEHLTSLVEGESKGVTAASGLPQGIVQAPKLDSDAAREIRAGDEALRSLVANDKRWYASRDIGGGEPRMTAWLPEAVVGSAGVDRVPVWDWLEWDAHQDLGGVDDEAVVAVSATTTSTPSHTPTPQTHSGASVEEKGDDLPTMPTFHEGGWKVRGESRGAGGVGVPALPFQEPTDVAALGARIPDYSTAAVTTDYLFYTPAHLRPIALLSLPRIPRSMNDEGYDGESMEHVDDGGSEGSIDFPPLSTADGSRRRDPAPRGERPDSYQPHRRPLSVADARWEGPPPDTVSIPKPRSPVAREDGAGEDEESEESEEEDGGVGGVVIHASSSEWTRKSVPGWVEDVGGVESGGKRVPEEERGEESTVSRLQSPQLRDGKPRPMSSSSARVEGMPRLDEWWNVKEAEKKKDAKERGVGEVVEGLEDVSQIRPAGRPSSVWPSHHSALLAVFEIIPGSTPVDAPVREEKDWRVHLQPPIAGVRLLERKRREEEKVKVDDKERLRRNRSGSG